jgi:Zinc finger, C3HC4 type (RING finger)
VLTPDSFLCDECHEPYAKHQEHLSTFKNAYLAPNQIRFRRQHSVHSHEMREMRETGKEVLEHQWRIHQLGKNMKKDTFECSVCYMEHPTKDNIAYLECGHYFCRGCLKEYFNFMIMNGKASKIKRPNSECKTEVLS